MNDAQSHRPVTSKARGICKYYTTTRGCFARASCKFLHISEPEASQSHSPILTPYDKAKRCRYYANGYCKRADKCWFLHIDDTTTTEHRAEDDSTEEICCSICFEKPATFGLLDGCSHIFCLQCIRQWRQPSVKWGDVTESGNTKKCPMCRARSRYIIPSSQFWTNGQPEKLRLIQKYKESMNRVPCKYFKESRNKDPANPLCPFGKECFYQHLNDDGSPYIFKDGADASMLSYQNNMRRSRSDPFSFRLGGQSIIPFPLTLDVHAGSDADLDAVNLAGTIAMDMYDRMVEEVMEGQGPPQRRGRRAGRTPGTNNGMVDQATLDRARRRMMAGAVTAIQAELSRLDPRNVETTRPVVVPGTLAPSEWDWAANGAWDGEVDHGPTWGWNDPLTEPTIPADTDVIERLGILADHMLGSLHERDTLPPLEPIIEPTSREAEDPNAEDDIPALESVSNSSESEVEDGSDSEPSDYDEEAEAERVENAVRAFDLVFNGPPGNEEGSSVRPLFRNWNQPQPQPQLTPPPPAPEASSRFSTVVGRDDREIRYINTDDDDAGNQGDDEGEIGDFQEAEAKAGEESTDLTSEPPPFVTDGRGRVVWSNKAPETGEMASLATTGSAEPPVDDNPNAPRTFLGRVFGVLF